MEPSEVEESGDQHPKPAERTNTTQVKRKKYTALKLFGVIFASLVAIAILALGYFGFVPGISNLLGANKPKDLGVTYTDEDFKNYIAKTNVQFADFAAAPDNPTKPGKKIVFADPKPLNGNVSQSEITAAINNAGWLWMPLSNTQVRFGDGTVEISGNLNIDYITQFITFIGGVGYEQSEVDQAVSWAGKFVGAAPVYIKANASVANNVPTITVTESRIGRFSIPVDIAQKVLQTGAANAISRTPGLQANSTTFSPGQINYDGTIPTTVYVKK